MGSCGPRLRLMRLPQPLQHLSLQERMAYALLELHAPRCLGRDHRQRGYQAADFAEASSSHALKAWSRWQDEVRVYGIQDRLRSPCIIEVHTVQSFESIILCTTVRIYSTEERRLHTTCLETAKKAMESFGLFE